MKPETPNAKREARDSELETREAELKNVISLSAGTLGPFVTHLGRLVTKQFGLFHFGLSVDVKGGSFPSHLAFSSPIY